MSNLKATKTFKSELVKEYSSGAVEPLGEFESEMNLYIHEGGETGGIEWIYEDEEGYEDVVEIGLWFEGNKVTDYDGVFELPAQAIEMLKENGYDTDEVE